VKPLYVKTTKGYVVMHESGIYLLDKQQNLQQRLEEIELRKKPTENFCTDKKYTLGKVIIFVTSDCNLRCVYCYADSGKYHSVVSLENAKILIKNVSQKVDKLILDFHGGGEPLLYFDVIKEIYNYALATGKLFKTVLISNGVIENRREEILNWIVNHVNVMALSCDGPEYIQNRQRAKATGEESIETLLETIRYFNIHNFMYTVRSTITGYSVKYMEEIVKFFHHHGVKYVVFCPCYTYGRSNDKNLVPNAEDYCENYMKAVEYACEHDIRLTCNSLRFPGYTYCGSLVGFNIALTTDNCISTCYEVVSKEDPVADYFIIGKVENGKIIVDHDKVHKLAKIDIGTKTNCDNCNYRLVCRGGCPVKKIRNDCDSLFNLCAITKKLVPLLLEYIHENPKYVSNILRNVCISDYAG